MRTKNSIHSKYKGIPSILHISIPSDFRPVCEKDVLFKQSQLQSSLGSVPDTFKCFHKLGLLTSSIDQDMVTGIYFNYRVLLKHFGSINICDLWVMPLTKVDKLVVSGLMGLQKIYIKITQDNGVTIWYIQCS